MTAVDPEVTDAELDALMRACDLAERGVGTALPNPMVGCVLLAPDGTAVGDGYHQRAGGPHAEIVALTAAGERARGATAVVTLEPCNHTGRTGPCSQALIAAGVTRVVVAVRDPWPTAAGGMDRLRAAGVDVVDLESMTPPRSADDAGDAGHVADRAAAAVARARDVNRVWLCSIRAQRPFVTLKIAMSVDGRVAAPDGTSRWLSSPQSRAHAHRMRGRIDAIMVGVGTVLADDPALTARDGSGALAGRQPLRVIADSTGRTPPGAQVRDGAAPTLIATSAQFGRGADGHLDLAALLRYLYVQGVRHLVVEGGPRLAGSVLDAGLADELLAYVAPLVLGAGRSAIEDAALGTLAEAHRGELHEVTRLGPDVLLRYGLANSDIAPQQGRGAPQ